MESKNLRNKNIVLAILLVSIILNLAFFLYVGSITPDNASHAYRELETRYNILYNKYQELNQEYTNLSYQYREMKSIALVPPYSSISEGNISWVFYDIKGNMITWTMPLETYRSYVTLTKPKELVYFNTIEGTKSHYDIRPYIQPSFFQKVITLLTFGRSDREFVKEVDNIKNQIVIYDKGLGDAPYKFPVETLTEGGGICVDTTVLMSSMLIEGNRQENYDFKVYVWYVHLEGDSLSNQSEIDSNHAIVEVEFQDGESWCIETTSNQFFTHSQEFHGWRYDITSIVR